MKHGLKCLNKMLVDFEVYIGSCRGLLCIKLTSFILKKKKLSPVIDFWQFKYSSDCWMSFPNLTCNNESIQKSLAK